MVQNEKSPTIHEKCMSFYYEWKKESSSVSNENEEKILHKDKILYTKAMTSQLTTL